jgi:hypothetical protein
VATGSCRRAVLAAIAAGGTPRIPARKNAGFLDRIPIGKELFDGHLKEVGNRLLSLAVLRVQMWPKLLGFIPMLSASAESVMPRRCSSALMECWSQAGGVPGFMGYPFRNRPAVTGRFL